MLISEVLVIPMLRGNNTNDSHTFQYLESIIKKELEEFPWQKYSIVQWSIKPLTDPSLGSALLVHMWTSMVMLLSCSSHNTTLFTGSHSLPHIFLMVLASRQYNSYSVVFSIFIIDMENHEIPISEIQVVPWTIIPLRFSFLWSVLLFQRERERERTLHRIFLSVKSLPPPAVVWSRRVLNS